MLRLRDRVIIVTGGANGIGRVYSEHLFRHGARVVIADIDLDNAEKLAAEMNDFAGSQRALALRIDVTSEADTESLARVTVETFERIDVLVNNAGSYPHVAFEDISFSAWHKVLAVNLDSVFLCSKAALPYLKRQGSGKIINIATNLVWSGLADMVHYITAKAGVVGFTRSLAREMGEFGITVNAVAPGAVVPDIPLSEVGRSRLDTIVRYQCIKRNQRSEDLIGAIVFLCSPESDFISGQVITVDGGLTMH